MIRAILYLLLISLIPSFAIAQSCGRHDLIAELDSVERAELDRLVADYPFANGTHWRAHKADSEIIIVGTLHIPDPRFEKIVDRLAPEIEASDLLIIEASADDEKSMQALAATQPEMFFITEGPTLIDLLTEEEWADAEERLAAIGVPGFFAAKFQPWYLSMTLAIPPCAMRSLQSGALGLDRQLEKIALSKNIEIATLDNVVELLSLFADETIEKQLDGLRITLGTQGEGNSMTSTLVEAYFDGRVSEAWEFGRLHVRNSDIENGEALFEEINQTLLLDRNADWEPKIVKLIAGKNAVIAVGAAHLAGETGVLRSLERAGYTLTPY